MNKYDLNTIEGYRRQLLIILNENKTPAGSGKRIPPLKELAIQIGASILTAAPNRLNEEAWEAELVNNINQQINFLTALALTEGTIEQAKATRRMCFWTMLIAMTSIISLFIIGFKLIRSC